jgi:hypothetical protein
VPIDDPLDALQKQLESEDRAKDPVAARIADLASIAFSGPLAQIIQRLIGHIKEDKFERIELTLKVMAAELHRHENRIRELSNDHAQLNRRTEGWFPLVQDGIERAQRTRAKERIERIGKILANAFVAQSAPPADEVEELMRVAMELSDKEVALLGELVRIQASQLDSTGRVPRYTAWESWLSGNWNIVPAGELESAFSKLESFGLVSRMAPPNNLNIMADIQTRYSLLRKGVDFVNFART